MNFMGPNDVHEIDIQGESKKVAPLRLSTVSSLDCSATNKNAEYQLNGNDVIGQWSRLDCRLS